MKNPNSITKKISDSRRLLQNQYAYLNGDGNYEALIVNQTISYHELGNPYACLDGNSDSDTPILNKDKEILHNSNVKAYYNYSEIEQKVRELQRCIWKNRNELWPDGVPDDPVQLLDPSIAAKYIGYEFEEAEFLGEFCAKGTDKEIAGIIDHLQKRISLSRNFKNNIRRFTAAHELGHALLHEPQSAVMHRDRPIDGSSKSNEPRATIEKEADKFATYFLMPEKLVRARFRQAFGVDVFVLNDDTAFALNPTNPDELFDYCRTTRNLAKILASIEHYNGRYMCSLANQFAVSVVAMAIRIEELGLVR